MFPVPHQERPASAQGLRDIRVHQEQADSEVNELGGGLSLHLVRLRIFREKSSKSWGAVSLHTEQHTALGQVGADSITLRVTEEGGSVAARPGTFLKQRLPLVVQEVLPGLHLRLAELIVVLDFVH